MLYIYIMSGRNEKQKNRTRKRQSKITVPSTAERKRRGSELLAAVGTHMLREALQEKNADPQTIAREVRRQQRQITEQQRQRRRRREQERIMQQQRQQEMLRQQQMIMT